MTALLDFLATAAALLRDIILPIFALIFAGWLADRKFRLDLDTLVRLNIYLFVPAFIFVRVSSSSLSGALATRVVVFTLCVIGGMYLLSTLAALVLRLERREEKAHQLSTMFYNSGNYGIPLMALAYPGLGPTVQPFVLLTMNVATFSIGLFLASTQSETNTPGRWRHFLPALRQPTFYAIAAAFLLRGLDLDPARAPLLWEPLNHLANALVGFALVTLGVQLSRTKPPRIAAHMGSALGIRLLCGPALALGLALVFGFEGEVRKILILGAAVPTAVNTSLLAHEFKADSAFAASAVFYSTLLSLVTVTLTLALLR